jgi:hypothetical protein
MIRNIKNIYRHSYLLAFVLFWWEIYVLKSHFKMEDMDFLFENRTVRMIALQNHSEMDVIGITIGPFEKGEEFDTKFWIAEELMRRGVANFREDNGLNPVSLHKIHWREIHIQTGRRLSSFPGMFYPNLRKYLSNLKKQVSSDPSLSDEYEQALRLAHDIVDCRLKKIVSLSSSQLKSRNFMRNLCTEERFLYDNLYNFISSWKLKILGTEES